MVRNCSRAAATSGEVASRQTPTQQPSATVAHRQQVSKSQTSQMQDRPRRSPAEVRAVASTKILRIQAAIASLGADDIEERSSLEAALSRAQRLLVIPPVDKRRRRAKKRFAAESAKIEQAEKQRQVFEEELAQAERDLECFRREAETAQAGGSGPCLQESQDKGAAFEAELSRACAELALLKGGVDPDAPCGPSVKRPCRTGKVRAALPAMPTLVPAELNMWLEERHVDLRDALLKIDRNRALELTADGVEQIVEMTGGMLP